MRIRYVLPTLIIAMSAPAIAADVDLKPAIQKIASAYAASFNKQDAAGIAAMFAPGGIHVNPAGARTDVAQLYEGTFKAGFNHEEITVDQVWPLGTDIALAMGQYKITGKNQSGAPMEIGGIWTATDVRDGGTWKIRMLSALPKPPQPPK